MTRYGVRYAVTSQGLMENVAVTVEDGRVTDIGTGDVDVQLGEVVMVPGLVNAHSHSFQRVIRGRTEFLDRAHTQDSFWSWRTRMYAAAATLGPRALEDVAAMAFLEMQLSGITTVGEFHYLHHQPDGQAYPDPNTLAHRVIAAARRVGIRISLLRVAYHRAGFGHEARSDQKRFVEPDVDVYLERTEALATHYAHDPMVSVGFAPHSVRAVPRPWLHAIAEASARSGRALHIHGCEQRRELEECRAEYGMAPLELLEDVGALTPRCTVVHATHIDDADRRRLAKSQATVCACPTTEQNLGDGFLHGRALVDLGIPIALGSDSQAEIDLWSEARAVEYQERLCTERRNVMAETKGEGERYETAATLWPMLQRHGARALGWADMGTIEKGNVADLVCLDLQDPTLAGLQRSTFLGQLIFSTTPRAVKHVFVGGRLMVSDGRHAEQGNIVRSFAEVMDGLGR